MLGILIFVLVALAAWFCVEYEKAQRKKRYQQENSQYYCYGHGYTYESLGEYVFYEGRTRTHAHLCTACAVQRSAIPARASQYTK